MGPKYVIFAMVAYRHIPHNALYGNVVLTDKVRQTRQTVTLSMGNGCSPNERESSRAYSQRDV